MGRIVTNVRPPHHHGDPSGDMVPRGKFQTFIMKWSERNTKLVSKTDWWGNYLPSPDWAGLRSVQPNRSPQIHVLAAFLVLLNSFPAPLYTITSHRTASLKSGK